MHGETLKLKKQDVIGRARITKGLREMLHWRREAISEIKI